MGSLSVHVSFFLLHSRWIYKCSSCDLVLYQVTHNINRYKLFDLMGSSEILIFEWLLMLLLLSFHLLRYKNELDRSQPAGSSSLSSSSLEPQPYTTPQKSFSTPAPVAAYRQQGILFHSHCLCHAVCIYKSMN